MGEKGRRKQPHAPPRAGGASGVAGRSLFIIFFKQSLFSRFSSFFISFLTRLLTYQTFTKLSKLILVLKLCITSLQPYKEHEKRTVKTQVIRLERRPYEHANFLEKFPDFSYFFVFHFPSIPNRKTCF